MKSYKQYLQRNKKARIEVAAMLNISKKNIQYLIDNLLTHAEENNWIVTAASCEQWASEHIDSMIHEVLDWDQSQEQRIELLENILSYLSFLITDKNKIYSITLEAENV
jgi:predicted RNA methylase